MNYLWLFLAFSLNSTANIMLKIKSKDGLSIANKNLLGIFRDNAIFFLALALFALNIIFYFMALKKLPLSVAYPVMTVATFIIVNSISFYYLKEPITFLQVIGYFLVLAGIFLIIYFTKH